MPTGRFFGFGSPGATEFCSSGMPKPRVLPVPVLAWPMMSRPRRAIGRVIDWIGKGVVMPLAAESVDDVRADIEISEGLDRFGLCGCAGALLDGGGGRHGLIGVRGGFRHHSTLWSWICTAIVDPAPLAGPPKGEEGDIDPAEVEQGAERSDGSARAAVAARGRRLTGLRQRADRVGGGDAVLVRQAFAGLDLLLRRARSPQGSRRPRGPRAPGPPRASVCARSRPTPGRVLP